MLDRDGSGPNLVELYDKYDREDRLAACALGAGTVVMLGITGLTVAVTPSSGFYELVEGTLRPNAEVLNKWATNVITGGYTLVAEAGVGFIGWKRSETRRRNVALEIADAEGRVPDGTNLARVEYTSALASTLIYGINFKPSRWNTFVNTFARPIWEMSIPYAQPDQRRDATFRSFDRGVEILPFNDEWTKYEVGVAALNLGKGRWENIAQGKGSTRLRSYSYVMLDEINRRLGDAPPQ